MIELGNILIWLARALHAVIRIYTMVIFVVVILSWLRPNPYNPAVRFIHRITDPVFVQVRRLLPAAFFRTGLDFTPVIVLLLLMLIDNVVVGQLLSLGRSMLTGKVM